jgi:hypothetical protein
MFLTQDQISLLRTTIAQSVNHKNLQEDLLDHVCCVVESKMDSGKPFALSVTEAIHELAPDGFGELQAETEHFLMEKTIPFKKIIFTLGLVSTISFTMGLMMKLLHMPGGEQLINYGFLAFALLFLPGLILYRVKSDRSVCRYEKLKWISAFASAVVTILAVFLKMNLNLDASGLSLMIGASIFSFGFLPLHFYSIYRKSIAAI